MDPAARTVSGKFFVHLSGKTNNAHQSWVRNLNSIGQTQVSSPSESDYLVVFCPIASRIGTDIGEAMDNLPDRNKLVILVVMHHTFSPEHVVTPSSRQVDNPNVILTVDCLFYEGQFLNCSRNDIAWSEVQKALGYSDLPFPTGHGWLNQFSNLFKRNRKLIFIGSTFLVGVVILAVVLGSVLRKKDQ